MHNNQLAGEEDGDNGDDDDDGRVDDDVDDVVIRLNPCKCKKVEKAEIGIEPAIVIDRW